MALTRHKSLSSLTIYEKVNDMEKLNMVYALGWKMSCSQVKVYQNKHYHQYKIQHCCPPQQMNLQPMFPNKENVAAENAVIPLETPIFDLNSDLGD